MERPDWQDLVASVMPPSCKSGQHRYFQAASDAAISVWFPGFFADKSHRATKLDEEWCVCLDCGYARIVRPRLGGVFNEAPITPNADAQLKMVGVPHVFYEAFGKDKDEH